MQEGALNIFEAFQTFHNVLSCFGFMPFRLDTKSGKTHKSSVFYTAFFLSLYSSALLVLCVLGHQEPDAEESSLVRYGNYSLYLQFTSIIIFVVVFNCLKWHKIVDCLLLMHHFDCMMKVGQEERIAHYIRKYNWGKSFLFSPQSFHCNEEINHSRQRRMISFFMIKGFVLFAVKTAGAFYLLSRYKRAGRNTFHFTNYQHYQLRFVVARCLSVCLFHLLCNVSIWSFSRLRSTKVCSASIQEARSKYERKYSIYRRFSKFEFATIGGSRNHQCDIFKRGELGFKILIEKRCWRNEAKKLIEKASSLHRLLYHTKWCFISDISKLYRVLASANFNLHRSFVR